MTSKEKKVKRRRERRRESKVRLIEYKGGKCEDCGLEYDGTNPYAFDFHHINPEEKEFSLSAKKDLSFDKLIKEVDKCMMLCKLCHSKFHFYNG